MAYGTMSIGGLGMKTNDDFIFDQDGTMKINKLTYYPVGSIYQSIDPTSPAELFGGTWESIASNRVLIGSGDKYAAESIGGEETVTLSQENIPNYLIKYNIMFDAGFTGIWGSAITQVDGYAAKADPLYSNGSDVPHNNIQPYYAVYMWKRVK